MTIPQNPIVNSGLLYVNGLRCGYVGNKSIAISTGAARDSTNINDISLSSNTTVNALNVGPNGIDSGTLAASTYYAVYVIGDSTNHKPTATLISASATNPFLPEGYDMYRRIAWIRTDSSANILPFEQMGDDQTRKYYYAAPLTILTNGSATSFTLVSLGTNVPNNTTREILVSVTYTPSSAGNSAQFQISNTLFGANPMIQFGCGVAATQFGTLTLPTLFQFIVYKVVAGDTLTLNLSGYTDYLD